MKRLICISFLLIASTVFAQSDKRLKGLEKQLNQILTSTKAPSFTVAIVEGKKIIYAKGFGYKDYENKTPADANTLYAIGSSTKAFTSSILGQLRKDEKLTFDDSPIKHVPDLKFANDEMNNNIIIKDLMTHRTGLPRHDMSWYFFPTYNKDSLMLRIAHQEPFTGVRQQWFYNNFMFLTQGIIAERITGKSWEDNIKERFFKPLGMNTSTVNIDELEKSTNKAIGYKLTEDDKIQKLDYYRIAGMSPAGSINSSVNEMSNWLITWINNGKFRNKEILPEAYVREAMSSQMVAGPGLPDNKTTDVHGSNYGYGWFISSYKGHYRVEHGGNIDGFSANVAFYPSDSIGIVVLTNQNGSAIPSLVRNTIADRMLKEKRTDWNKRFTEGRKEAKKAQEEAKKNQEDAAISNTTPSHALSDFTGEYSHPGYGIFNISIRNDSLIASYPNLNLYLKHVHYDVFEPYAIKSSAIGESDLKAMRLNFRSNSTGDIDHVQIQVEATIDPIEFKRKPNSIDVDLETLNTYVGEYEISGMTITLSVKNEKTLYALVPGQPEYELLATEKHMFSLKKLDGYKIKFVEGENGKIVKMKMIQPNGTFVANRK